MTCPPPTPAAPASHVYGSQHVLWWGFYAPRLRRQRLRRLQATGSGPSTTTTSRARSRRSARTSPGTPTAREGHRPPRRQSSGTRHADTSPTTGSPSTPTTSPPAPASNSATSSPPRRQPATSSTRSASTRPRSPIGRPAETACSCGETPTLCGLDVKYLEVDNAQGRALDTQGLVRGQSLAGVTVEYGRAVNTNLNPRFAGQSPWDAYGGVVYKRRSTPAARPGLSSGVCAYQTSFRLIVLPARSRRISRACRTLPGSVALINLCRATVTQCR